MTKQQRADVVLMLRCAADIAIRWPDRAPYSLFDAERSLDDRRSLHLALMIATRAVPHTMHGLSVLDEFGLIEAALLVEEGRLP